MSGATRLERTAQWLTFVLICALGGAWIGAALAQPPPEVPLCQEDEVITADGECVPLLDADYVGGVGWTR